MFWFNTIDLKIEKVKIGFSNKPDDTWISEYRLTSKSFWVDRSEVPELLEANGCHVCKCNPFEVVFEQLDSVKIESIEKQLRKLGKKLKKDQSKIW